MKSGPIIDAHLHLHETAGWDASRLIALMNEHDVARAVLMQNPTIGTMNEAVRGAIARWPARFIGTIQVDPRDPRAATIVREFAAHPAQRIVKFEMSEEWGWSGKYPGLRLDEPALMRLWDVIGELRLDVIIDPGAPGNNGYQIAAIAALAQRFPETRIVVEHLGYPTPESLRDAQREQQRRQCLALGRLPNIAIGFSAVPILLGESPPFPQTLVLLREALGVVGAGKLLWGSDAPSVLPKYTYRQLIECVTVHADFLSETEVRALLRDNARRFYRSFDEQD